MFWYRVCYFNFQDFSVQDLRQCSAVLCSAPVSVPASVLVVKWPLRSVTSDDSGLGFRVLGLARSPVSFDYPSLPFPPPEPLKTRIGFGRSPKTLITSPPLPLPPLSPTTGWARAGGSTVGLGEPSPQAE